MSTKSKGGDRGKESVNEVRLEGTVSGDPQVRVMPSGDELCVVRVVVPRASRRPRSDGRSGPSVDVLDCCAWDARPRRALASWRTGDRVELRGSLRRRFYRVGGGPPISRVEVEISKARLLRRAASG